MTDLITKQDYLNEIEKLNLDGTVKKPTIKWTKPDIVSFYEQYKPRDDNIQTTSIEQSTPFKIADLIETGITEIKTNVGEEIAEKQETTPIVKDTAETIDSSLSTKLIEPKKVPRKVPRKV